MSALTAASVRTTIASMDPDATPEPITGTVAITIDIADLLSMADPGPDESEED